MKFRETIKEFSVITVGTLIVAAVFFFMLPSHALVGSGAALAMVLSNFIPLSVIGILTLLRKALGDTREHPSYIETIHGFGYRFLPQT